MNKVDQLNESSSITLVKCVPRIFVGLILIATGTGKALDMAGFVNVLEAYQMMPLWMSILLAYSLPFIELLTGIILFFLKQPIKAAWVAVILHLIMLIVVTVTYFRGIAIANCGCFGVFLARPLTLQTIFEDLFMLIMSLLALKLAVAYSHKLSEISE